MNLTLLLIVLSVPMGSAQTRDLHRLYKWDQMEKLESVLAPLEANPKEEDLDPLLAAMKLHRDAIQGAAGSSERQIELRSDMYGDALIRLSDAFLLHFDRLGKPVSPVELGLGKVILRDLLTGDRSPMVEQGLGQDFAKRKLTLQVCFKGSETGEEPSIGSDLSLPFAFKVASCAKIRESLQDEAIPVISIDVVGLRDFVAANYSLAFETRGRKSLTDVGGTILLRHTSDGYIDAM